MIAPALIIGGENKSSTLSIEPNLYRQPLTVLANPIASRDFNARGHTDVIGTTGHGAFFTSTPFNWGTSFHATLYLGHVVLSI